MDRVKERELMIFIVTLMTNARLELLTSVWYLVMLSKNCLQVKRLGIKKASLLLLNSTGKYFDVLALCGIREFLWDHPPTPPFFNLSNPTFLYLDCEPFTRFQVAQLQCTMTSLFHLTTCFVVLYRK